MLAGSREMEKIAEAVAKIQKHAGELLNWEPAAAVAAR